MTMTNYPKTKHSMKLRFSATVIRKFPASEPFPEK